MCGIAGIIDSSLTSTISSDLIEKISTAMKHRGPDSTGSFYKENILQVMTRLSIIDLDQGDQPFLSPNKKYVIFQNGEIYNYKKLRKELEAQNYTFDTHCDTEVISIGYEAWGITKLLEKLDGMYAISIFDTESNTLYLIRDRFGEKPLFYCIKENKFAYSSYLKTFKYLNWIDFTLSKISLVYYICLHYIPGQYTIFNFIKKVLPGHYLEIKLENLSIKNICYYKPKLEVGTVKKEELLLDLLQDAVSSRLEADVPVGIFLSGGIDSSIITALASNIKSNISTFSMGFYSKNYDESTYSNLIAERFKTNHTNLMFNEDSFLSLLSKVIKYLDEPVGDQAILPVYWLAEQCKGKLKVVLSGEGGDEIFGGYSYYPRFTVDSNLKDISNRFISKNFNYTPSGFPLVASMQHAFSLLNEEYMFDKDYWESSWIEWLNSANDSIQYVTSADLTTWLPDDLLVKFDRMTMANSIEGRAPFLDPKVVEFCLNLHADQKIFGTEKVILKNIAEKLLPEDIIKRKKQGFVLPMEDWITSFFKTIPIREFVEDINFPFFNTIKLGMTIGTNLNNPRFVFSLIVLLLWYKNFFQE